LTVSYTCTETVQIVADRGQLLKGKQSKYFCKTKNEGNFDGIELFIIVNHQIQFEIPKHGKLCVLVILDIMKMV
jgi:hypothetical protein